MVKHGIVALVVGTVLTASAISLAGGAPNKPLESKCAPRVSAVSVDFAKELGLDFPSLPSLGARIEAARSAPDPVALLLAGIELGAAEKASGKQASIKSADLIKEATDLAMARARSAELKAIATIVSDEAKKRAVSEASTKAEKFEADLKAKKDSGEQSRGIMGVLHVDNRSAEWVRVYVNGYAVGLVAPYGDGYAAIGNSPLDITVLHAESATGAWNHSVTSPVGNYTWILGN